MDKIKSGYILLPAIILCWILFGCNEPEKDSYSRQIDSLETLLQKDIDSYSQLSYNKLLEESKDAFSRLESLATSSQDSLEPYIQKLADLYSKAAGGLGFKQKFETDSSPIATEPISAYEPSRQDYVKRELNNCIQQLKNLKADYLDNRINEEELKKYLEQEKQAAEKIMEFVHKETASFLQRDSLLHNLKPNIQGAIDSIKSKKEESKKTK